MKRYLLSVILGLSFLSAPAMSAETKDKKEQSTPKDFKVNPYGKELRDIDGNVEVQLAIREDKNVDALQDALIKITGAAAHDEGIDGQVLYYKAVPAGSGFNYVYNKNGEELVRMISRDSWGSWKNFEIYVNHKTFKIFDDTKKSKDVKTSDLLRDYKKSK